MMPPALAALLGVLRTLFWPRAALEAEVLALRNQLLVLKRQCAGRRVSVSDLRSRVLVLALAGLARMAPRTHSRPPGDRDPLVPTRLSPLLALEEQVATFRTAAHRSGDPRAHRGNASCESHVGRGLHPWRTAQARLQLGSVNGLQVSAKESETAFPELANFLAKSSPGSDRHRLCGGVHGPL